MNSHFLLFFSACFRASLGTAMLMYRGRFGSQSTLRPKLLRAGVYLAKLRRFVALAPWMQSVDSALVDLANGRILLVDVSIDACESDFCPRLSTARVLEYRIGESYRPKARWKNKLEMLQEVLVRSSKDAARVAEVECWGAAMDCDWMLPSWVQLGTKLKSTNPWRQNATTLGVNWRGSWITVATPTFESRGRQLVYAHRGSTVQTRLPSFAKSATRHSVISDETHAAVLATRDVFDEKRGIGVLTHELYVIDLASKKTSLIQRVEDDGAALARQAGRDGPGQEPRPRGRRLGSATRKCEG